MILATRRTLAFYIVAVATAQLVMYAAVSVFGGRVPWLFYFDPRIGLFVLETMLRNREVYPGMLSWTSAFVLWAIGFILLRHPDRLRTYLFTEAALALPTLVFFVLTIAANIGPAHGFAIGELVVPVPVFIVASGLPFWIGCRSLRAD